LNIVRDTRIYESNVPITDLGGDYSNLSLWTFFKEDNVLKTKCLFKNEVIDINEVYTGSLVENTSRWTRATEFSTNNSDSSPSLLMDRERVRFAVWSREGQLYAAPKQLTEDIVSIQTDSDGSLESTASVSFDNIDGRFTSTTSELIGYFQDEKQA
jgi:hypothetical protein